jgi:uracil-DNA glycosylase
MSDLFQQALRQTLPALAAMKSRHPMPSASTASLERLMEEPTHSPPPARPKSRAPSPSPTASPTAPIESIGSLDELRTAALACEKCPHLVASRTGVVFGTGNPSAEILFVGEAPGADEDAQGEPFVGRAGQLLTRMIEAMGLSRADIYIANILKCRPDMPPGSTGNRKPKPAEMSTCLPWLERQIALIRPRVMIALGATAAEGLLGTTEPMGKLRGRWHAFHDIPVMVTYHPAYLLRNQSIPEKRKVWEDLLMVLDKLGHPVTAKQRAYFSPAAKS